MFMTIQYKYLLKTHKNRSTFNPPERHRESDIWPVNGSCGWDQRLWWVGVTFTWLASGQILKVGGGYTSSS